MFLIALCFAYWQLIYGAFGASLLSFQPWSLWPGKNVVHQLDLMNDLLETPSSEAIARVCLLWGFHMQCHTVSHLRLFILFIESLTVHCRYEMRKIGDTKPAGGRRSQSLSPRSSLMHIHLHFSYSIKNVGIWAQGSAYHGEGNF